MGVLVALPLVLPSYVAAFALVAIAGPRGVVQDWLEPLGIDRLPPIAHGYSGALLALALFTYPYVYLMVVSALRGLDPALEESSRSLGTGRTATFFRVTLPQLRAAIYGGSLLVALYAVSDFGAVSIARYDTLTLGVFHAYTALFDRGIAAAGASILALTALLLIGGQALLLRRIRPASSSPSRPPSIVPLGRLQWPCQFGLSLLVAVTVVGPLAVILVWGVRGLSEGAAAFVPAFDSLLVSAAAAFVAATLSVPVAAWAVRRATRVARLTERLCYSGYALPGLVIALALVFLATRSIGWAYQTLGLLIAGYVIRFLPEAISATRSALSEVPPILEEAACSLGEGPRGVLRTVTLPLIRPGLLAGGGLVFLTAMKELPATLILRPAGFETLATRIWSSASEGVYAGAAVPSLLLVSLSAVPVYVLIVRPALARRDA